MRKILLLFVVTLFFVELNAQTSPLYFEVNNKRFEGPTGPEVQLTRQGNGIEIGISNDNISNNYQENFWLNDTSIHNGDQGFRFQGYVVYQVINDMINPRISFFDVSKMRLVGQSDIVDTVVGLTNYYLDTLSGVCTAIAMVQGNNAGVEHSYLLNTDAFTGNPFQFGEKYCFYVFPYAHNGYKKGDDCNSEWSFLTSFSSPGGGVKASCTSFYPLSVDNFNSTPKFTLYPNPALNNLTIEFEKDEQLINLSVVTIHGQQVLSNEYENTNGIQLNVSDLSSGIYFAQIITGEASKTVKFVKK